MSSTSIERASAAGPRVPRTRLDRIAEWYRASPVGTWGVVVINALFQTAGIGFAFSLGTSTLALKCVLSVMTSLSLIWRRNWPLMIVISNNVALMMKMIKNNSSDFLLPLLVAVYTLIAIASVRDRLLGIAATVVFMFIPYLASFNGPLPGLMEERVPLSDFMEEAGLLIVVVTVASITRSRRESLEHGDTQLASHAAEQQLVVQRDAARYQARVAAELHDSVGHGLTTIIVLSEGLTGATGDTEVDEALAGINAAARECLEQTREAVRALGRGGGAAAGPGRHTWDDVHSVIASARSTGMAVAFHETGRRPPDEGQADLAFAVAREGITNALRHARGASVVTVSWDHRDDGWVEASVRDDGRKEAPGSGADGRAPGGNGQNEAPGGGRKGASVRDEGNSGGPPLPIAPPHSGLSMVRSRVVEAGGACEAGWSGSGWALHAHIPPGPGARGDGYGNAAEADAGTGAAAGTAAESRPDAEPGTGAGTSAGSRVGTTVRTDAEAGPGAEAGMDAEAGTGAGR